MFGFLARLLRKPPAGPRLDVAKRFRLHEELADGSMSRCWRATDLTTRREVCLKVLDQEKIEEARTRTGTFIRPSEGQIAVALRHPNIVETFEHGLTTRDEEFLVMEFVRGIGLSTMIETRSDRLARRRLKYLIPLAEAIAYCHQAGYIHRDICPRNVLIRTDKVVKLIDFGLAVPDKPEFHKPGNRTGTANYMAPELIKRQTTDSRIDVFSFGVIAYQVFTWRLPWPSTESLQGMLKHINTPAPDPREFNSSLTKTTASTLSKGIALDPRDRFQSMSEFVAALKELKTQLA